MIYSIYKQLLTILLFCICSLAMAAQSLPGDDWLHVEGNQILDKHNNPVWLTGANWFGLNASERTLHGLWSVNLDTTLEDIASRGINILRIPISTVLIHEWENGIYLPTTADAWANKELDGATNLEAFDALIDGARKYGLKILLDMHGAEADNMGHLYPMWYKGQITNTVDYQKLIGKDFEINEITTEDFYSAWQWIAERYKNDDTIVAFDLQNEPHGKPWADTVFAKWDDSTDSNNWKHVCETVSNKILDIHPNILLMCEGIESYPIDGKTWTGGEDNYHNNWWGGNLRGVADYPINLGSRQQQFMYSPHDYGPKVFAQPWFYPGFSKQTLYDDLWKDNWMFIHEQNIAPLLIGEWGGFMDGEDNEAWMVAIRDLIIEHGLHHTFWCINPNSGDTGGLLDSSWTAWDEEKYALFEPSLWKNDAGKFIGLDHEVPLGSSTTGISLNQHYQTEAGPSVSISAPNNHAEVNAGETFSVNYSLIKASHVNAYLNGVKMATGSMAGSVELTAPVTPGTFTVALRAANNQGVELGDASSLTLEAVAAAIEPQPKINIERPTDNQNITQGETFEVQVSLTDATGFAYELGNINSSIQGNRVTLTAPAIEDSYTLKVTAINEYEQTLAATDSLIINVLLPTDEAVLCQFSSTTHTPNLAARLANFVRPTCQTL